MPTTNPDKNGEQTGLTLLESRLVDPGGVPFLDHL
jgi:hypothetical protein